MMESLQKSKLSLSATLPSLASSPNNLSSSEWQELEDCVEILRPIEKLTTILSGEQYPTLSSVIPLIRNVQSMLIGKICFTNTGELLKKSLLDSIDKRLGILESNKTAAKATFIDPRFKKAAFGVESNAEKASQWIVEEVSSMITARKNSKQPETDNLLFSKQSTDDLWDHFDEKISQQTSFENPTSSAIVMVKQYLSLPYLDRKMNPLVFWEEKKNVFPDLYQIALKYLCIPATSVPSERIFSKAGLICNQRRNRLNPGKLDQIMFLNSFYKSFSLED